MIARFRNMIGDRKRTPVLLKAIRRVVKRGDVVLDLGCGTAILSFAAIRAGASRVYACDVDPVIHRAAREARKRGVAGKIVFIQALSSEISLPEKVDVILSETVGSLGLNENILPFVRDARRRFLKRNGRIIPQHLAVYAAPVEIRAALVIPATSESRKAGIQHPPLDGSQNGSLLSDSARGRDDIKETPFLIRRILPGHLLADGQKYFATELRRERSNVSDRTLQFHAVRDGILTGFAGWIEVAWTRGLVTRTSPFDPPTHWKQAFLTNKKAEKIRRGDRITFRLRIAPRGNLFSTESSIEWGYESTGFDLSADETGSER